MIVRTKNDVISHACYFTLLANRERERANWVQFQFNLDAAVAVATAAVADVATQRK